MSGDFEIGPSADRINDVFEDEVPIRGKTFFKAAKPALVACIVCPGPSDAKKKERGRLPALENDRSPT